MEWFLLNVDVVGEEDTVNFYEDETQGGLVTVRTASITRDGPGGRIQELGVPGCGTFAFEYRPATPACRPRARLRDSLRRSPPFP